SAFLVSVAYRYISPTSYPFSPIPAPPTEPYYYTLAKPNLPFALKSKYHHTVPYLLLPVPKLPLYFLPNHPPTFPNILFQAYPAPTPSVRPASPLIFPPSKKVSNVFARSHALVLPSTGSISSLVFLGEPAPEPELVSGVFLFFLRMLNMLAWGWFLCEDGARGGEVSLVLSLAVKVCDMREIEMRISAFGLVGVFGSGDGFVCGVVSETPPSLSVVCFIMGPGCCEEPLALLQTQR
ncbi:hypothetical protein BU23DRAFT_654712, partial [Bimuria novae-zelandiae CBS 107.79]